MFEWNDHYSVGIKLIDDQHKELLSIGNELEELLKEDTERDRYDDIVSAIGRLSDYTKYHFKTEEDLFEKYAYVEAEAHVKHHNDFVDYLEHLDLEHVDENQAETAKKLLTFIAKWIFKHISDVDFRYSDFLKEKLSVVSCTEASS